MPATAYICRQLTLPTFVCLYTGLPSQRLPVAIQPSLPGQAAPPAGLQSGTLAAVSAWRLLETGALLWPPLQPSLPPQIQPTCCPARPAPPRPALRHLQTGPVLQAYYRFGPFECDPANPNRLLPASAPSRQPPLILLPGMGATMIAWGTPLLRALACSHEVGAGPLHGWPCMPGQRGGHGRGGGQASWEPPLCEQRHCNTSAARCHTLMPPCSVSDVPHAPLAVLPVPRAARSS